MVIKFDHISFVCARNQKAKYIQDMSDIVFMEKNIKNLRIKGLLMQRHQDDHDLYFSAGTLPTEYIFYDFVKGMSSVSIKNEIIYGGYSNKEYAVKFLKGIFGENVKINNEQIICNMRGILDKRDYFLILSPSKITETYLDRGGYGAIAIITNKVFRTEPEDGICTEHGLLRVNDRNLDICFTRSDSVNIIFEIIRNAR